MWLKAVTHLETHALPKNFNDNKQLDYAHSLRSTSLQRHQQRLVALMMIATGLMLTPTLMWQGGWWQIGIIGLTIMIYAGVKEIHTLAPNKNYVYHVPKNGSDPWSITKRAMTSELSTIYVVANKHNRKLWLKHVSETVKEIEQLENKIKQFRKQFNLDDEFIPSTNMETILNRYMHHNKIDTVSAMAYQLSQQWGEVQTKVDQTSHGFRTFWLNQKSRKTK